MKLLDEKGLKHQIQLGDETRQLIREQFLVRLDSRDFVETAAQLQVAAGDIVKQLDQIRVNVSNDLDRIRIKGIADIQSLLNRADRLVTRLIDQTELATLRAINRLETWSDGFLSKLNYHVEQLVIHIGETTAAVIILVFTLLLLGGEMAYQRTSEKDLFTSLQSAVTGSRYGALLTVPLVVTLGLAPHILQGFNHNALTALKFVASLLWINEVFLEAVVYYHVTLILLACITATATVVMLYRFLAPRIHHLFTQLKPLKPSDPPPINPKNPPPIHPNPPPAQEQDVKEQRIRTLFPLQDASLINIASSMDQKHLLYESDQLELCIAVKKPDTSNQQPLITLSYINHLPYPIRGVQAKLQEHVAIESIEGYAYSVCDAHGQWVPGRGKMQEAPTLKEVLNHAWQSWTVKRSFSPSFKDPNQIDVSFTYEGEERTIHQCETRVLKENTENDVDFFKSRQ